MKKTTDTVITNPMSVWVSRIDAERSLTRVKYPVASGNLWRTCLYFDKNCKTSYNSKLCLKRLNPISKRRLLILLLVFIACVCTATIIIFATKCISKVRALEMSTVVSDATPYQTKSTHPVPRKESLPSSAQSQAVGQKLLWIQIQSKSNFSFAHFFRKIKESQ